MVDIVPFQPRHTDGVVALILPIQQREFGVRVSIEDQPDLLAIPEFYQRGAGNFWVALDGDRVVGTVALLDIGNGQAALRKMFVYAEVRGADAGVARRLLEALLAWCPARGVREIYLGTTALFHAAHRFYEKNGFRAIRRESLPLAFPVMEVDTRFYTRAV